MGNATDVMKSLVPISQFSRGKASQIFDRLKTENELVVLKNNQPTAVILSPEEYNRLTEVEEDYILLLEANRRLAENGEKKTVPFSKVLEEAGITEEELEQMEDIEIE